MVILKSRTKREYGAFPSNIDVHYCNVAGHRLCSSMVQWCTGVNNYTLAIDTHILYIYVKNNI